MRPALAAVGALAAAALLASCSSAPPQHTDDSPGVAPSTGHGAFAHCLTDHGVPAAPGPVTGPPPGVDEAAWQQAMQSCGSLAPGPG
jgi:hypothetical protein